jgi:hypothetical protein
LGYVREKQSKLSQEQFEDVLKAFCFISYFDQRYDYDYDYVSTLFQKIKERIKKFDFETWKFIQDLKSAISLWTEDNGLYSFAHRSLQEYFAALFLKNLDPSEKERAYKRIIERFSQERRAWGVENFLLLCSEMDEVNYSSLYYLPMLKDIRSYFNPKDDNTITISFVLFFTKEIFFQPKVNRTRVRVRNEVYKSLYIHLPFTQQLFENLTSISYIAISNKELDSGELVKEKTKIYKFEKEVPIVFREEILKSPIKKLSLDFYRFIIEKIRVTEEFLELLDLI